MAQITMAKALNTALRDAMEADDRVVLLGEDVGTLGGVFRITDGLQKDFGEQRVMDTPLAESGIMGISIGLALRGYRPVCEMQFDGFSYPALDQVISHLAKYRNRSGGKQSMPVVCRIPCGGGIGAVEHHSESPETLYAHTAGLKVVIPSAAADAYSLLRQSIEADDPVIFLEPKRRYWAKEETDLPVTTEPVGTARVLRQGSDCTLVAYGAMVKVALDAAEAAEEEGIGSLEVIDLRSLVPLDDDTLVASATRTGRMVVVHEAPEFLGFGAEVAARVTEAAFLHLEAPVLRCTGLDIPYPPARLEEAHLPGVDRVLWTVQRSLDY
ncbi:MAG TPA: alpha-ketoacid dehydrogenase subunit beta [Actinomycetes bacterium]|jgi:pyruvate dehydrogenase E1 component beta subunit|nr:alpha-ketoacid dehydrogenase subunit beta [Actinomycetes bacterium]